MNGDVVDRAGVAAAGGVDHGDRVVGEQGVGAAGEFDVVVFTQATARGAHAEGESTS